MELLDFNYIQRISYKENQIGEVGGMGARLIKKNNYSKNLSFRNGHTDRWTNRQTDPLLELKGHI